ncbi:hypothetical protein [Enterococcus faecalis]|uniref:hypothetical protein n=1 Tax=Enterococcus faecalis TaxID=1351 RepID=UPI00242B84BF|nr:hypothetical protein [Enterococcus faecalis]
MNKKNEQCSINRLMKKLIVVVTMDGKKVSGVLKGVTKYELYVEQVKDGNKTGQYFVLFKHAVKYIRWQD